MIENRTHIRVRYAETDKMGIVYYARYLEWFEVGRTELLRSLDMPYAQLEKEGVGLPVIEAFCKYRNSAKYDDLVQIVSRLSEIPKARIKIEYEVLDEQQNVLAEGYTIHIFMNQEGKPMRPPAHFIQNLAAKFSEHARQKRESI